VEYGLLLDDIRMNIWIDDGTVIWGERNNIEEWEHLLCDMLTTLAISENYTTVPQGPWMILK